MGDIINAIILGLIQGLTEFLPVSSSGHLEIGKFILGDAMPAEESMLMTVVLHFGTALATIYVFRKDVMDIIMGFLGIGTLPNELIAKANILNERHEYRNFVYKIVLSMIPAVIVGLVFEKQIEAFFSQNILLVCTMLLVTGVLLLITEWAKSQNRSVTYADAIIVGVAQAIAILPGISRSGATISTSIMLGIDKSKAARFSFLMVVPLIFGKIAKDLLDGDFGNGNYSFLALAVGFVTAFFTGIFACKVMIELVKKAKLSYFAYYCFAIGILGIAYIYLK